MKNLLTKILYLMFAFCVVACSDDDGAPDAPPAGGGDEVCYVLNSGDWKSSNSSLTMCNLTTGETVQNYFELRNGRCLGNTANDMIVYGSKMYIAVAGEGTIEVVDLGAKSLAQIECGAQPRYLAAHGGKVYATYYDGYVARIDTFSLVVDATVKVGRNPEQLAVCDRKLFVANSGGMDYNTEIGYDNTVSVIDLTSFTEIDKIEVVVNPANVVSDGKGVFVVSYGNYADIPSILQYFSSGGVSYVLPDRCRSMTEVCYNSGVLYGFFSSYDANWNATTTYLSYGISDGAVVSPWINESYLPVPYKVCAAGEFVCVTSSDYLNDGDVYLYDTDGMLVSKISAGLNPVKVVSLK
ncbi:MAG: hypothetical protein IKY37_05930 [Bacteroidaceae bacterium]|nr:hypothetical protein [Bacteroidaceae bacterium]